ncbi:hypothetical protein RI129_007013 [Pyrocoelia pectoralis]|uniref:CBM39 domain-containing protein n=1 Tax=Pyrocoelia pectoralis TaxID=417401 RepID=A0AAN7VAA6_9COLE
MLWVRITAVVFVLNFKNSLQSYVIPQPEIKVYGEGFSVSIPHVPGINSFTFNGNVNRDLFGFASGDFAANVKMPENGKWIFRDLHNKLKIGDVIYYRIFVVRNGLGYRLEHGRFDVKGKC